MKKAVSAFMAVVLIAVSFVLGSSSEGYVVPEILSVEIGGKSEYGYVEYNFLNSEGEEIDLFDFSYLPDSKTSDRNNSASMFSSYSAMSSIPSSYDSRNNGYITSVKQQGVSGNCWAFSTLSMLETDAIIKGFDDIGSADYSEAHFSWFTSRSLTDNADDPTYGDGYISDEPYLSGGNWIIAAGSLSRWTGAAEEADYPFNYRDLSAMGNYDESCRYDTGSGTVIDSAQSLLGMDDAKSWIMEHGSATLSFYFSEDCFNSGTSAYYYAGEHSINHEITVVGWNDNYSRLNFNSASRPSANGAWLCKNSWGRTWGDNGYFWISYYDNSIGQFAGISSRSADDFYRNYTYNGAGWQSYINHVGTAKIANVFKAKGSELITDISTYVMMPEQEVCVYIYKNLPSSYRNPEQGSLALKKTFVVDRPGYHILNLGSEIAVNANTVFSVVIEYVAEDGATVYFPIEADSQGTNSYHADKGESFLNLPSYNLGWYDVLSYSVKNNYIQAFTKCNHKSFTETSYATCENDGFEKTTCSVCNKVLNETVIPAAGHDFTDWTDYIYDVTSGDEVRTRYCLECGVRESDSIRYYRNTIKIDFLLQQFFDRIIQMLREIF